MDLEASNLDYAERAAQFLVESFLGFLSYSENFLSHKLLFFHNISGNKSFNEIKYDEVVVLNKNRIIWPKRHLISGIKKNTSQQSPMKFTNYDNLVLMYQDLLTIKSEKLWELVRKSFFLYYQASSEEIIQYSFLKFWIIAETLIKSGKAKSDEEVKSIMKSMVGVNDILKMRIDYLDKKRNRLVHRGENVTVGDRDLIKIIADLLLVEAIHEMGKLRNIEQFSYYLSNIKAKKKDRESYIQVLTMLNEQGEQMNNKKN